MGRGAVATPSSHLVVSAGIEHLPLDALPRHLQKSINPDLKPTCTEKKDHLRVLRPVLLTAVEPWANNDTAPPGKQQLSLSRLPAKRPKHTTGGIPRWSPTLVLVARFSAYVWQSGRDAQFSLTYGRMCLLQFVQALSMF
jgi:hypothetical protein